MNRQLLREIAWHLYPRPILPIDSLNRNAGFHRYVQTAFAEAAAFGNRFDMYEFLNSAIVQRGPIDFLEFGVAGGESILSWARLNDNSDSRFFGFDSFEGLPEAWTGAKGVGTFTTHGEPPSCSDPRVRFLKGLFQHTLRPFLKQFVPKNRLVIHIDCDLYSAALFTLATLDELLPGSILMFDEFCSLRHEFAAWHDYSRAFYRSAAGLAFTSGYLQVAMACA